MQETVYSHGGLGDLGFTGAETGSPDAPLSPSTPADVKKQRRKSRLSIFFSNILTPSSSDPHEHTVLRKPVSAQFQTQSPPHNQNAVPSQFGLDMLDTPPPVPLKEPLREPPKITEMEPQSHMRKPSLPVLLKKAQKIPTTVLHSHPPATQTQIEISETPVRERAKSVSPPRSGHSGKLQPTRLQPPDAAEASMPRLRSSSAQPPKSRVVSKEAPRVASPDSRPQSSHGDKNKRKSWLPGGRSRTNSKDKSKDKGASGAWIITPDGLSDYHTMGLENGDKVRSEARLLVSFFIKLIIFVDTRAME